MEIQQYQCTRKVYALKINLVMQLPYYLNEGDNWLIVPEDCAFDPISIDHEFYQRHRPQAGGYYVLHEDGFKSYSPAKVFEEGYTLIRE